MRPERALARDRARCPVACTATHGALLRLAAGGPRPSVARSCGRDRSAAPAAGAGIRSAFRSRNPPPSRADSRSPARASTDPPALEDHVGVDQNRTTVTRHRRLTGRTGLATPCVAQRSARSSSVRSSRSAARRAETRPCVDRRGRSPQRTAERTAAAAVTCAGRATVVAQAPRPDTLLAAARSSRPSATSRHFRAVAVTCELIGRRIQARRRGRLARPGAEAVERRPSASGRADAKLLASCSTRFLLCSEASSTCSGGIASQVRMWNSSCARSKWRRPGELVAIDQHGVELRQAAGGARHALEGVDHQNEHAKLALHDLGQAHRRNVTQLEFGGEALAGVASPPRSVDAA